MQPIVSITKKSTSTSTGTSTSTAQHSASATQSDANTGRSKAICFISLFEHRRVKKRSKKERGGRTSRKKVKVASHRVLYSVFWNQPGSCVVVNHSTKAASRLCIWRILTHVLTWNWHHIIISYSVAAQVEHVYYTGSRLCWQGRNYCQCGNRTLGITQMANGASSE